MRNPLLIILSIIDMYIGKIQIEQRFNCSSSRLMNLVNKYSLWLLKYVHVSGFYIVYALKCLFELIS